MLRFIRKRLLWIVLIVALVIFFDYSVSSEDEKLAEMRMREAELKQQISEKRIELSRLEDYYAMSQTLEFIERMAREKLGMVKPDEIIYSIEHPKRFKKEE